MIEVNAINNQQVTQGNDPFAGLENNAFGIVKSGLIGPLLAIANSFFDSIKQQEAGNANLAIGLDQLVSNMSDDKKSQVDVLAAQLTNLYNTMPQRSDFSGKNAETEYHNALAQHQSEIQGVQAQIQEVKSEDDATTNTTQSLGGNVADQLATILKNSDSDYEMGKSILNAPVSTVANMISSLGAPQS